MGNNENHCSNLLSKRTKQSLIVNMAAQPFHHQHKEDLKGYAGTTADMPPVCGLLNRREAPGGPLSPAAGEGQTYHGQPSGLYDSLDTSYEWARFA